MKKGKIILAVFILNAMIAFSQAPVSRWITGATLHSEPNEGICVEHDSHGNIYVAGKFSSAIAFGADTLGTVAGATNVFLAKFDPAGNPVWAKGWGGVYNDHPTAMAIDADDNILLAGYFQSPSITFGSYTLPNTTGSFGGTYGSMFIAKIDPSGGTLWAKGSINHSSIGSIILDMATDPSRNVIVVGMFNDSYFNFGGTSVYNTGLGDVFIYKFDGLGNEQWARSGSGSSYDWAYGVNTDAAGNIYVTGAAGTVTFGSVTLSSAGSQNLFLLKYTPAGALTWGRMAGGTGGEFGSAIQVDPVGNVYVSGYGTCNYSFGPDTLIGHGGMDVVLLKYNVSGNPVWGINSTGTSSDYSPSSALAIDDSCHLYLTGYFQSPSIGFGSYTLSNTGAYTDIYLASVDSSGNIVYAFRPPGRLSDVSNSITVDAAGGVFITGRFNSDTLDCGAHGLVNLDTLTYTMFLAKFNGDSAVISPTSIEMHELSSATTDIYPNPGDGLFTLRNVPTGCEIKVYSILGDLLFAASADVPGTMQVDLRGLSKGIYLVQLSGKNGEVKTAKLIIQPGGY
ncbi:MAG: type sorting protein [Bacteroidetes bacterium]|nr:type sorting protein [Bacteroidota bacterium]